VSRLPSSSSETPRRPRARLRLLRRGLLVAALALVVLGLAARPHLEDRLVAEVTRRLERDHGLRTRIGRVEVRLLRLRLEVTDLVLERDPTAPGRVEITVPYARLDLGWRSLLGWRRGRYRFDRAFLEQPRVVTHGALLVAARPESERREPVPLDVAAGHVRITGGAWTHDDETVPLDLEVSSVELRATLAGDGRTMLGAASARVNLALAPLTEPLDASLATQFRLRGERLELLDLRARAGPAELSGEAVLKLASTSSVDATARIRVDLAGVDRLLSPQAADLEGALSGTLRVRGGDRPWGAEGRIEGSAVRIGPVGVEQVQCDVVVGTDRVALSDIKASLLDGVARGWLELSLAGSRHMTAEVEFDEIDSARLLDWLGVPVPVRARTDGRVRLAGDPANRRSWFGDGTFELRVAEGGEDGVPTAGSGGFSIEAGRLALDAPDVRTDRSAFAVGASLDLAGRPLRGEVRIQGTTSDAGATQADVLRILDHARAQAPDVVLRALSGHGTFAARFPIGGPLDLQLDLDLHEGAWGPQRFDRATVRLASQGGQLALGHLDLTAGATAVRGALRIGLEPRAILEADLTVSDLEIAEVADLFDVETDLRGRASGTIRAARVGGGVEGTGTIRLTAGRWLGEPFDEVTSSVVVSGQALRFANARVIGPAVEMEGQGTVDLATGNVDARIEAGRVRIERLEVSARGSSPFAAEVQLSGPVRVDPSGASGLFAVESAELRIRDVSIGSIAGQIELLPEEVVFRLHGVDPAGWSGTATVGLADPQPVRAELALDAWPLEGIDGLPVPTRVVVSGRVEATGPLGEPARWDVGWVIAAAEIHVGARRFEVSDDAPVRMANGTIDVGPLRIQGPGVDVTASLRYGLESGEMDGELDGTGDLTVLAFAIPDLRAQGTVEFKIRARGTADRPELDGFLRLDGGRVRHLGLPYRFQAVTASAALRGSNVEIESFRAVLGGGEIEGSGRIEFGATGSPSFELGIRAAGVRLEVPEGFEGIYDAELEVGGTPDRIDVRGRADLLRGLWSTDLERPQLFGGPGREYAPGETPHLAPRTFLDLDVVATHNVWVRNQLAEIEAAVDLHLGGTLERPQVAGRTFALEGGRIEYRGLRYQVRSGSLEFTNPDRIEPFVAIEAETSVSGYDIQLRVSGTPDRLAYELTSSPALSSQDIIALLATGKTLTDLEQSSSGGAPFTGDLAANYFAGVLTDPFEDQLAGLVGLDTFRIDPLILDRGDPTTRVTLGKKIRDDLTVVYSYRADRVEDDLYQVEWRANRRATLTAERATNGGLGATVYYTHRYWWRKAPAGAGPAPLAETGRTEVSATTVGSVRVEDDGGRELADLAERVPLRPGARYRRADLFVGVENLRRAFVRRGYLEVEVDARPTPAAADTIDVVYRVRPGPVYRIEFDGVTPKEEKKLRQRLDRLWSDSLFVGDLYADSVESIRVQIQDRGYFAVDVDYAVIPGEERLLRFRIDRGGDVHVARVAVEGAVHVGADRVRRQMLTRPPGWLGSHSFVPSILESDLAAIRNLYRSLGYLGVKIAPPEVRLSMSGETVDVAVTIDEGPLFTVRSLGFPDTQGIPRQELEQWSGLRIGLPVTRDLLADAEAALRRELDRRGRAGANVRVSPTFSADGSVDLRFEVDPGPEMHVAGIQVEGNFLTRDDTIRKALDVRVGDPVTVEQLVRGQRALYRLGTLQSVRVEHEPLKAGEDAPRLIRVRVTESRPLRMAIGAGYNTESKVNFSLGTSLDNVAGRARSLGTRVVVNDELQSFQLFARAPTLFGSSFPALASLVWEEDRQTPGFAVQNWSLALRADRQFSARWSGFARYAYQLVDVFDITDPDAVDRERLEDARLGNVEVSAVYDTRDDPIAPTQGLRVTLGTAVFAPVVLSDFSFLRGTAAVSRMWTLRNRVALVTAVRLGAEYPFRSTVDVPISERFFAGGSSTVRGFDTDLLGPLENGLPTGGEGLFLLNEEVRIPIFESLHGVAFYDAGNVYRTLPDFDPTDLRHVLGAGIRFETPIGPLRAEYGWKLDRMPGEEQGKFFFSIGNAF